MIKQFQSLLVLTSAILLALPAQAMTASQTVEVERTVTQEDGSVDIVVAAPDKVIPGDLLIYTVNYFNDENDVTSNFRIDMPVPAEITYLEGSAQRDDAVVLFSIDDGKSFAPRETLIVNLEGGSTRSALSEDITHIRWTLKQDVNPGDRGQMSFKGRLK